MTNVGLDTTRRAAGLSQGCRELNCDSRAAGAVDGRWVLGERGAAAATIRGEVVLRQTPADERQRKALRGSGPSGWKARTRLSHVLPRLPQSMAARRALAQILPSCVRAGRATLFPVTATAIRGGDSGPVNAHYGRPAPLSAVPRAAQSPLAAASRGLCSRGGISLRRELGRDTAQDFAKTLETSVLLACRHASERRRLNVEALRQSVEGLRNGRE